MEALLRTQGLAKSFGALRAVDHVDLALMPGEVLGVIGPNGSGKSTLFNMITGVLRPDGGRVIFGGREITGLADWRVCRLGLAKTDQVTSPLSEMTALENVMVPAMFGAGLSRREAVRAASDHLQTVGLAGDAGRRAGSLTVAMRRRLDLARALAVEPKVILLDENLAGLTSAEVEQALDLLRAINARGIALIMVEHIMQAVVGVCQRVIALNLGRKIAEGPAAEVMRDPAVVRAYLGDKYA